MRSSQVIGDALAAATGAAAIAVDTATGAAATAMVLACAAGDGMVVETSDGGAAGAGARTATAIGGSVCFGAGFGSTRATIFESVATETSPQFSKRSADTIAIRIANSAPTRRLRRQRRRFCASGSMNRYGGAPPKRHTSPCLSRCVRRIRLPLQMAAGPGLR